MLDNILNSVRRGAERVQRRGEEVAQGARLRLEVFGLTRELDSLYARLGRSYHAGAAPEVLSGIQDDIRRVDEEISARERLLRELDHAEAGQAEADPPGAEGFPVTQRTLTFRAAPEVAPETEPTVPDAVPRPHEPHEPVPDPGRGDERPGR
ncbi:hypothetical protein DAERI_120073 [Deinococcus aerius]|uniref:Uncharacterized protein n=1 Tax=Deinococcus aerius TaxID=200253 RepID=A0A2I9D926_9DEIO|nr:hypothetical protein [Deinococcus aerius]GBF07080.1 hypothetical protein DAERI_120073 [Deinococcus aerius]